MIHSLYHCPGASLEPRVPNGSAWKLSSSSSPMLGAYAVINITGINCNDWMVSPEMHISAETNLSFEVAYTAEVDPNQVACNYEDDKFYVLVTTDNGSTWSTLMTWGSDDGFDNLLDSLHIMKDTINISLSQYMGDDIRIAFYGESTVYGGDNNLYIDNLQITQAAISCLAPTDVVASTDQSSLTLTWLGGDANFDVQIYDATTNEVIDSAIVSEFTYTFQNLIPNTIYAYRVRQICSEGVYSDWVSGAISTANLLCSVPSISISDITGNSAIVSWQQAQEHLSWEVNVFNTMSNEIYQTNTPSYHIIDLSNATSYSVAVRAQCSDVVYSDWSDTLVFSTDDCLPVSNVTVSDVTANSANINWTANDDETSWEINYGESGFGQGEGDFVEVNATSYIINNLESDMDYDVYIRTICSEDFYSIWSDVVTFTTLASEPEGIDGVEGNFQCNIYPNPAAKSTTISLNGIDGLVEISIVDMNGRLLQTETLECGSNCEKRIDVDNLAQGTYFVRILGNNINSVRKLIVR